MNSQLKLNLFSSRFFLFAMKRQKVRSLVTISFRRNGDFHNGRLRDGGVRNFPGDKSNFDSAPAFAL